MDMIIKELLQSQGDAIKVTSIPSLNMRGQSPATLARSVSESMPGEIVSGLFINGNTYEPVVRSLHEIHEHENAESWSHHIFNATMQSWPLRNKQH